ncbi:MAG: hypothetical protein M5U14_02610 [Acidimicrobiia bacterium]|nr:hypothetical protein [Acidimicrobiia bacterium]
MTTTRQAPRPTRAEGGVPHSARPGGTAGRIVLGLALALLSGGLATLAFPPFELWPLVWVAFVPMVVAQHRVMPARWSGVAIGVGFGAYFSGQLSNGLAQDSVAIAFQLLPLYVALLVTALAWRSRAFHERTGYRWLAVSMPVAWVALDFLRATGQALFGGTWANPVYALFRHPAFLQPVSVFGIYGLELLILVVNFALAGVAIAVLDRRSGRVPSVPWTPSLRNLGLVVAAVGAWGLLSVALLDSPGPGDQMVRVAAVQTGVGAEWDAGPDDPAVQERLRRDVEQTRDAAEQGAQLVVWSEKGLRFDPRERPDELRALAAETGAYLAIGYGYEDEEGRKLNEATLLAPDGELLGRYGKDHPGTFAGDYSDTGGTYPVYETELGPISTIICYDLDFTDTARKMTRNGARLVAAPSSDVTAITETHYTHLVFRSIENRVPTVKADTRFDSAIIDPWGRILARTVNPGGATQATLVADVPLGSGRSPFVSLGDWVGWLCVVGAAGFVGLSWWTRRRPSPTR